MLQIALEATLSLLADGPGVVTPAMKRLSADATHGRIIRITHF